MASIFGPLDGGLPGCRTQGLYNLAMKSAVRFVLLALVLLIVAMVSALTAMRFAIHGQEVTVPGVGGDEPRPTRNAGLRDWGYR